MTSESLRRANKKVCTDYTDVDQRVPSLVEVAVCNDADGLTELCLNGGRDRDHQPDQLALDGYDLGLWQLVVSILVLVCVSSYRRVEWGGCRGAAYCPIAFYEVFEEKGACEAGCVWVRGRGDNVEEGEGEAWLALFLPDGGLGCENTESDGSK